MTVRVIADLVALVVDPPEQTLLGIDILSDDEEGRLHAARPQRVEDHRRPAPVRPVVEGEGDFVSVLVLSPGARDDVRHRHPYQRCRGDVPAARIDEHVALSRCGPVLDLENLSRALELGVVARRDLSQTVGGEK